MNLHEYQVKQLFARYGLSTPVDYACTVPHEIEEAASEIGVGPQIVKCQIHAGGRSKAGGVRVINSKENIRVFVENWLGKRLVTYQTGANGQSVNQILAKAVTDIVKGLYLDAVVDRSPRHVVFMVSTEGSVEIEGAAEKAPYLVHKVIPDPLAGPMSYQEHELAFKLDLEDKLVQQFIKILMGLATISLECDLVLIETNPLVVTKQGDLVRPGGRLGAGDNTLLRQSDLREMRDQSQEDLREVQAAQWELNYTVLDGNVDCMVNSADLAMGTMDIVKLCDDEPANFLDVGGGVIKERVARAPRIILSDDKVKTVPVDILGGIVCCDLIANSIIGAVVGVGANIPVMMCLEGSNAELGARRLVDNGPNIIAAKGPTDAAQRVVAVMERK